MSSFVTGPWEDCIDISEWTERDFESRGTSVILYPNEHEIVGEAFIALKGELDTTSSKAIDRALRVYLGMLFDGPLSGIGVHERYDYEDTNSTVTVGT